MSGFRPLTTSELQALRPVDLLAHHHEARRLGRHDEARAALGILVWGFHDRVRFWVGRNVPKEHVEDVCGDVFLSALRSSFEGTEVAQLGAWLRRIAQRRAADFRAARERRVKEGALPEEHEGDEEIWGPARPVPDPTEEVVVQSVVEQALGDLSDRHRRVVELAGPQDLGFEQRPAREAADLVNDQLSSSAGDPMTEANVHQILSRFRKRLAELVDPARGRGAGG